MGVDAGGTEAIPLPVEEPAAPPKREAEGYAPFDLLSLGYLAVNLVVIALGYRNLTHAGLLLVGFSAAFLAVASLRFVPRPRWVVLQFIRDAYPLLLLAWTYKLVGVVNRAFYHGYFDWEVMKWDRFLFGGHPNAYLAKALPFAPLSEFLHFCYYVYFGLIPLLGFTLYFSGRREQFRIMTTSLCTAIYSCFLCFVFFPVRGPFYTFPPVSPPGHVFPHLVYKALASGAAVGAAFPSSHVAISTVVAIMSSRFAPKLSRVIWVITSGIVLATVYGGFHYGVDAMAGLVIGVTVGIFGPRTHGALQRRARVAS